MMKHSPKVTLVEDFTDCIEEGKHLGKELLTGRMS